MTDIAKPTRAHKPPVGGADMIKSKHGRIDGQFIALLHATLDCPAWKAASHGARWLYMALKRRHPRERNTAYISYRRRRRSQGQPPQNRRMVRRVRALRVHRTTPAFSLGVDGKGKAPHWRLTELGKPARRAPMDSLSHLAVIICGGTAFYLTRSHFERHTWDYQKQNPGDYVVNTLVTTCSPPRVTTCSPPKSESGDHGVAIEADEGGDDGVVPISSLTTTSGSGALAPTSPPDPL